MDRTVYVIKPEAFHQRERIHSHITAAGLRILSASAVTLSQAAISRIYPNVSNELLAATEHHLCKGLSEWGIVEGAGAVDRLRALCGSSVDPSDCREGTIRRMFGEQRPIRWGTINYFRNAFHCSRDMVEVARDIAALTQLPATGARSLNDQS